LQALSDQQFWFKTGNVLVDDATRLKNIVDSHQYPETYIRYLAGNEIDAVTGVDLHRDGLLFVSAGWVNVKLLCEVIRNECGNRLKFIHSDVSNIVFDHGRWLVSDDAGASVAVSECLVVANGWMAKTFTALDWLPIDSVRGQLTLLRTSGKSGNIQCGISADRYITPADKGWHVVGASYNLDDESVALSSTDQQENINRINQMIPGMFSQQTELAGRVSFRAVSEDRVPVVGCVPDADAFESDYHDLRHGKQAAHYPPATCLPGMYVTTAHGSRGLASCFISGEIIASLVCNEPVPVARDILDYLNPARFIIRRLKRGRSVRA
jgi:tRNA 5-methylaminomethyl-2-thiouridine biosynthesis bifunctional protein